MTPTVGETGLRRTFTVNLEDMSLKTSELSSIADQLDDLVRRITVMCQQAHDEDDDLATVTEIERQLNQASRRLTKFVNKL